MKTLSRIGFALLSALALSVWSSSALAFEREWHLGAGLGGAVPPGDYELGPALSLHAAYGISDVFDLRLELAGSRHGHELVDSANVFSAAGGVVYKLDVIEWVPWAGPMLGYYFATPSPQVGTGLPAGAFSLGVAAGLDYALTRSVGLGVCFREDFLFEDGANLSLLFLRGEYRFGW